MNDNALAGELMKLGHDVVLVPTYTPTRTDGINHSTKRIFFGGINVYLDQRYRWFRRVPKFVRWLLDRPMLLNAVSSMSSGTKAEDLGGLTESMLLGSSGPHMEQLDQLASWLEESFKPEILHMTNSMFLGIGSYLKARLKCPVVCSLQGEDLFLDDLIQPYRSKVFELLRSQSKSIDLLIATSEYYANYMAEHVGFDRNSIVVVPLGIETAGLKKSSANAREKVVLGFFARQSPEKGLDQLIEAFIEAQDSLPQKLHLRVAGYVSPKDQNYLNDVKKRISDCGLENDVTFLGELDRAEKIQFLQDLDLISVPTRYVESKGLSILEAMAVGVPAIQPDHGVFGEMIRVSGGGILVKPLDHKDLATAIVRLAKDPNERKRLGELGQQGVETHFHVTQMAKSMVATYETVIQGEGINGNNYSKPV